MTQTQPLPACEGCGIYVELNFGRHRDYRSLVICPLLQYFIYQEV